jgi:hypothetical protein
MKETSESDMIMVFWDVMPCNSVSAELQGVTFQKAVISRFHDLEHFEIFTLLLGDTMGINRLYYCLPCMNI